MSASGTSAAPAGRLMVVTDLDGCLLDPRTYSHEAARPALAALARARCPLVPCSGKTRAEVELLLRTLGLAHPFIVENGGAIVFPAGSFDGDVPGARAEGDTRILALGAPRPVLISALLELARQAGVRVRGFAELSPPELGALTGLSGPAAALALQREFDEPFLVDGGAAELQALGEAAARRGLQVSHGGRFHHLTGGGDKGLAVRSLLALHLRAGREFHSVGFGDAETDLPLLGAVDRPVVVPRGDGSLDPLLVERLPHAERAPRPGPEGWNAAVLSILAGGSLARVDATAGESRP